MCCGSKWLGNTALEELQNHPLNVMQVSCITLIIIGSLKVNALGFLPSLNVNFRKLISVKKKKKITIKEKHTQSPRTSRTLCVVLWSLMFSGVDDWCILVVSKSKRIKYFSLFCTIFIRHGGDWGRPTTSRGPGCPIFTTWRLFCYHLINCGINLCKSRAHYYLVYMTRMIVDFFFYKGGLKVWHWSIPFFSLVKLEFQGLKESQCRTSQGGQTLDFSWQF